MLPKEIELILWEKARPYLKRGRPGDLEHTERVVQYGKELLRNEGGDPEVVIPSLIFHDTGWGLSNLDNFYDAPAGELATIDAVIEHMKFGAEIAGKELEELHWPGKKIEKITSIIRVHDHPDAIRDMGDTDATLVFEADFLDKFGAAGRRRGATYFATPEKHREVEAFLVSNIEAWFTSKTARRMLESFRHD